MNRLSVILGVLAIACTVTIVAFGGNRNHGTPTEDSKKSVISTDASKKPLASWPPRLQEWVPATPEAGRATVLGLVAENGKLRVSTRFKEATDGYNLSLTTVLAFSDEKFLGCHQRFEEHAEGIVSEMTTIPDLPNKTSKVVIRYQSFALDRKQWPDQRFSRWYSFTWSRFTTAVPMSKGTWNWRFERGPVDCDLGRWLTDSEVRFSRQANVTTVIMKQDLPKQK